MIFLQVAGLCRPTRPFIRALETSCAECDVPAQNEIGLIVGKLVLKMPGTLGNEFVLVGEYRVKISVLYLK